MSRDLLKSLVALGVAIIGSALFAISATAANIWDGGGADGNWGTNLNWDDDNVPTSPAALTFSGNLNTNTANNLVSFTATGLTFDSSAGTFTLGGPNGITLSGSVADNSVNAQTISMPTIALSATEGVDVVSGGSLSISSVISGSTFGLTKTSAGTLVLTGANTYSGVTTISGGVLSTNLMAAGTAASGIGNPGAAPATASLVLDGGTLRWTANASQSSNRGFTLTQNGGTIDSSPTTGATNLTISGALATSGSGARTLTLTGVDQTPLAIGGNVISGIIADGTGGATSIVKNGNNAWNLQGVNTYSGGSIVNAGRLRANTSASAFGTGPVTVANGAQGYLNVGAAFNNDFNIAGIGVAETSAGQTINFGALRLATNNASIPSNKTVTLTGDTRITARGAATLTTGASIAAKITGGFGLEFGNTLQVGILTLSNAANDWTGTTTVSLGILRAGVSSTASTGAFPHGSGKGDVAINGATTDFIDIASANGAGSTLDLNGFDVTINGLNSSSVATPGGGVAINGRIVNGTTGTPTVHTLTIGDNNANGSFSGTLQNGTGPLALTKIGAGTQILSGVSNYSGNTTVSGGVLLANGAAAALSSQVGTVTGGSAVVTGLTSTSGLVVGQPVSGTGVLGGAAIASMDSATQVTLSAKGSGAAVTTPTLTFAAVSALGTGAVAVTSNASLGGIGTIQPGGTNGISIGSGGVLAPGASIGTLTVDSGNTSGIALTLASGASLSYELNNPLLSDQLSLLHGAAGDIVFNNNVINFSDLSAGTLASGQYTLFTADVPNAYTGLTLGPGNFITSGLFIGTGLAAYTTSLQEVGSNIVVNVAPVPEPSAIVIGMLGMVGFALIRRRTHSRPR